MNMNRETALQTFKDYVHPYDDENPKIKLKIDHTLRVCSLCEQIALSSGFSKEDTDLAWLCGLLHDIGRFEQIRRYNTFSDALSVDHAGLSAQILFEEGKIRDYISDSSEDDILEKAVKYHSVYRLDDSLTSRERTFCNLLRDADKIDILKVNIDFPLEDIYNVTTKELLTSTVSPEVFQAFKEHHAVLRSLKHTPVDNIVGHISLVFELVYKESLKLVQQQGYLKKLCQFHSENPETIELFKQIQNEIDCYVRETLTI